MNDQFDELTKDLAQSVTRRGALKKFGVGLVGVALAIMGLPNRAEARHCKSIGKRCHESSECCPGLYCNAGLLIGRNGVCVAG